MATPKQLEFSSSGGDSNGISPSRRKSSRKPISKRHTSENVAEEETNKKNSESSASPVSKRIWNEEDELALLKGLVDYRAKGTGPQTKIDWDDLYQFVGGSIRRKFSKEQLCSKAKKLKRKYLLHMEKINEGNNPHFTRSSDSEAFGFSMMIWPINDLENANGGICRASKSKNDEEVVLNDNRTEKNDFNGNLSHHEAIVVDDDELCAVRDAFETIMSQGLSDYQKKLQLEKLMNLGTRKRRELSSEWKALCMEETELNIKNLKYSAKLAEAANIG